MSDVWRTFSVDSIIKWDNFHNESPQCTICTTLTQNQQTPVMEQVNVTLGKIESGEITRSTQAQRVRKEQKRIIGVLTKHRAFSIGVSGIIAEYMLDALMETASNIFYHLGAEFRYITEIDNKRQHVLELRQRYINPLYYRCSGDLSTTTDQQFFQNMDIVIREGLAMLDPSMGEMHICMLAVVTRILDAFVAFSEEQRKDTRRRIRMLVELELSPEDQQITKEFENIKIVLKNNDEYAEAKLFDQFSL